MCTCSCVLHVSLMYIYNNSYTVALFEPDSQFTTKALSRLEKMGVTIFNELEDYKQALQSVIGIEINNLPNDSFSVLNTWLQGRASLRPTWRHFFWALREIHLSHLADQIESFLSGASIEPRSSSNLGPSPESEESEGREEEDKGEEGEHYHALPSSIMLTQQFVSVHVQSQSNWLQIVSVDIMYSTAHE